MKIESLLLSSVPDASIDVIDSILSFKTPILSLEIPILLPETPIVSPQSTKKSLTSKKRKRSLSNVIIEISYVTNVKFDSLQVSHTLSQLRLPININTDHAYVIFSLF